MRYSSPTRLAFCLLCCFMLVSGCSSAPIVDEPTEVEQGLTLQAQQSCGDVNGLNGDAVVDSFATLVGSSDGTQCSTVKDYGSFDPTNFVSNSYTQMPPGNFQCASIKYKGLKSQPFCNTLSIGRVKFKNWIGTNNQADHLYLWFCDALGGCEYIDWKTFVAGNQDFSSSADYNIDFRNGQANQSWTPAQLGCGVAGYASFGYCMQPLDTAYWDASRLEIYRN